MHVIEIERSLEVGLGRTGEEVQTAVERQNRVGLLDDCGYRREYEHVVVALPVGQRFQALDRIGHAARVHVFQLDAVLGRFLGRVKRGGAVQPRLVDVGHDHQLRLAVGAVNRIVDRGETHRADAGQNGHVTALLDLHVVLVRSGRDMIVGVHRADHARQGLRQRGGVVTLAGERQQASLLHHFVRNHDVGRVAADESVRVTRRAQHADGAFLVVERGLDREFVARLEAAAPLAAHLDQLARELVSDDNGILGDVARNPLVDIGLVRGFVRRHADAVANHLGQYLVVLYFRQLELLQPEVVLTVESYSFRFHVFLVLRVLQQGFT